MSSTHVEPLKAFSRHFLSREHGGDRDPVPKSWQHATVLQPTTWYGLSSLYYSAAGMLLACLLALYPERGLTGDGWVAALLVWQGIISFKCDVLDLCVPSWSHPADRISASAFIACMLIRFLLVSCDGRMGSSLLAVVVFVLLIGFYAFHRSCRACHEVDLLSYARWHVRWHLAFPCGLALFWVAQFAVPLDDVHCYINESRWQAWLRDASFAVAAH